MSDSQIRVLLVDDHTLFRKGLAELLEQRAEITVVGMAANGDGALELLPKARPAAVPKPAREQAEAKETGTGAKKPRGKAGDMRAEG